MFQDLELDYLDQQLVKDLDQVDLDMVPQRYRPVEDLDMVPQRYRPVEDLLEGFLLLPQLEGLHLAL